MIEPFNLQTHRTVSELRLEQPQKRFVGDIPEVISQVSARLTGHVIVHDGKPSGFFILDHDYPSEFQFADKDSVGLRSFFISSDHQGQGLAKEALQRLPPYLGSQGIRAAKIVLTVNCQNFSAASLYRKCGFHDTGGLYLGGFNGPQYIMDMPVT